MCTTPRHDVRSDPLAARLTLSTEAPSAARSGSGDTDWIEPTAPSICPEAELETPGGLTPARATEARTSATVAATSATRVSRESARGRQPSDLTFFHTRPRAPRRTGSST